MLAPSTSYNGNGYRGSDNGKCICLSFPAHELTLIEELDKLAHLECATRSQYVRRLIRREKQKVKEQVSTDWSSILGEK
jgi:metal-responsive CopG/Arc/MetJ family transcriptional regulator